MFKHPWVDGLAIIDPLAWLSLSENFGISNPGSWIDANILQKRIISPEEESGALEIYTRRKNEKSFIELEKKFSETYKHPWSETADEVLWKWWHYIQHHKPTSLEQILEIYIDCISRVEQEPMKWHFGTGIYSCEPRLLKSHKKEVSKWVFKGFEYLVEVGHYTDEQCKLLILEDFDKERSYFEKLKAKFDNNASGDVTFDRPRIPENVRVEVWRRDSGKCARCGSREKLEYDHIVPISRGGSNTARNIEMLCEKCNRSKSNNVV